MEIGKSAFSQALDVASSGMKVQADRLRHTSENIANVDTPGYRGKRVAFEEVFQSGRATGQVRTSDVTLDRTDLIRTYDPGHPLADAAGYYDGSNVNLIVEIADAREAQRSYEANLRMFDQVRQMSKNLLDILRR